MNNELMQVAEFKDFIKTQGYCFENRHGVEIEYLERISARIIIWDKRPTSFELTIDLPADEFMRQLNIGSWKDVEAINEQLLWQQYRSGDAYVWADLDYLSNAELCFRIMNGKTVIISEMLGYHDEVAVVLDWIAGMRDYVREHIQELYIAAENKL